MSNTYSVLTLVPFSVSALLRQEAAALTLTSPTKGAVKAPNGSKSNLTQDGKRGKGPGHCIVRRWPSDKLPGSWGERNRAVLLDEIIQPTIWPKFSNSGHHALYPRATHSRLVTPLRSNDHGNKEGYRAPMAKILERLSAIAFIFFLNQWLLPENEQHPDLPAVLETLKHFEVKEEHTCKNLYGDVLRSDVVIQVGFDTPLPILKPLLGSTMVTMSMVNLKSSGNAEYQYASAFTSPSSGKLISSVDECMDHLISFATSCPTKGASVQELSKFISKETSLEWAQTATSHFSQVIRFCLQWRLTLTNHTDGL
jgi:hypothetical protein